MILLVDIGNSRTKYIAKSDLSLKTNILVINNVDITMQWLNQHWLSVTSIILASVAHDNLTTLIEHWAENHSIALTIVNSEKESFGVRSHYDEPRKLGVDRWLALLGTNLLFPNENILIVDAGTATTIDCLLSSGHHKGGWILPGLNMMITSLDAKTANVCVETDLKAAIDFATDTEHNVNNACWAATIGAIELAIKQYRVNFSRFDRLILTGGNAEKIQSLLSQSSTVVKKLIFHGLDRY